MSATPFMPLWVSDFLGDTLDLDATEIGAYMLLLMAQWNRDGDSLPNDTKKLQRVARCGRNWPSVWGSIERFFKTDENGVYSKRLRLEAQNVAAKREVNARNGSLGGKAKALKSNDVGVANATETLQRMSAIPEPEPYKKEITNVILSDETPAIDETAEALRHFNATAKTVGWPQVQKLTPPRRAAILGRLKDIGGLEGWIEAINRAASAPHLIGNNDRQWMASFDWLTKPANFTKLMEGNYDPRSNTNSPSNGNSSGRRGSHDSLMAGFAESANHGRG